MTLHQGSCLCGGVRYELDFEPLAIARCHCRLCRKASGSAFVAVAVVPIDALRIVAGEALLKPYESSPGKRRLFCANCGSPIYSEADARPGLLRLRIGLLDTPLATRSGWHAMTAHKAEWDEIGDGLPHYPELKPDPQP
jgi:hypothetical protein